MQFPPPPPPHDAGLDGSGIELETREAKMRELSNDLERFAPKRSDGERYARLHTLASSLAASLAFRYGEIAALERRLAVQTAAAGLLARTQAGQ